MTHYNYCYLIKRYVSIGIFAVTYCQTLQGVQKYVYSR